MEKTIELGRLKNGNRITIKIRIEDTEKGKALSICGNEWERKELINFGQMADTINEYIKNNEFQEMKLNDPIRADVRGNKETWQKIYTIWKKYHLNDLTPGCSHQMKAMESIKNHDYDFLIKISEFKKCPECGYAYGSQWLFTKIPNKIIEFLEKL